MFYNAILSTRVICLDLVSRTNGWKEQVKCDVNWPAVAIVNYCSSDFICKQILSVKLNRPVLIKCAFFISASALFETMFFFYGENSID